MIFEVAYWLACLVVLSVALARLESIRVTRTGVRSWLTRAVGWSMVGLSSFDGLIAPFFGHACTPDRLGMMGLSLLAVTYKWEGATRYQGVRRRANDF